MNIVYITTPVESFTKFTSTFFIVIPIICGVRKCAWEKEVINMCKKYEAMQRLWRSERREQSANTVVLFKNIWFER